MKSTEKPDSGWMCIVFVSVVFFLPTGSAVFFVRAQPLHACRIYIRSSVAFIRKRVTKQLVWPRSVFRPVVRVLDRGDTISLRCSQGRV